MEKMVPGTPLQQKPTPPTWQIEGPFSDLAFTSAGAETDPGTETVTQNSEHSWILKHKIRIHLELKLHRDNLEEIVRERTIEISKSHHKLHQEISERICVQKALIEQRAYFHQLFENSPHAIMIVETDGKIVEVNNKFETIFGYQA